MVSSIIAVICTVIVYWLKRKLNYEQDKTAQLTDRIEDASKAIAEGDEVRVNAALADAINRLRNKGAGNSKRQGSTKDEPE